MSHKGIETLNQEYGIDEYLMFIKGPNGLVYAQIKNKSASAQIFLHGAHLTSFIPNGQKPIIFLSSEAIYKSEEAIRGGIPISWPWFADHPSDSTKPAHGFARTSLWEVRETKSISRDETEIILGLSDSEQTKKLWDYIFDLELKVSVGQELKTSLKMTNTGSQEFTVTSAFHTYYNVDNVKDISIKGLEDTNYIDKVDNFSTKTQRGLVTISDETDRIYLDTQNDCIIEDRSFNRLIRIKKEGSNSTVVWNPWKKKTHEMNDLGDQDYVRFICVETTNAGTDIIKLGPGDSHSLLLSVSIENNEII